MPSFKKIELLFLFSLYKKNLRLYVRFFSFCFGDLTQNIIPVPDNR